MRVWVLTCLFFLTGALPLRAGAWLELPGETLLTVAGTYRWSAFTVRQEASLYAVHGLRPRLSLGFDGNYGLDGSGHALVFARLPLGSTDGPRRTAVEIGVGGHLRSGGWAPMSRLSLAHGRGGRKGWFDVAATLEHRSGLPQMAWKLEGSLGSSGPARLRPMVQAGVGRTADGVAEWRGSAHLLIAGKDRQTWVLGVERKRAGETTSALTLALWRRF